MQKFIIFLLITLLSEVFVRAQQTTSNPDLIFKKAKHLAFNNQWKEARETARVILRLDDHYQDARILIGRTYAWEHQFDSARFVIMQVLAADSSYRDAIDALTDIEFWAGDYAKALTKANLGIHFYPNDKDFLLKKAKILMAMGQEAEAQTVMSALLHNNPNSYLIHGIMAGFKKYHQQVNIEHTFDFYRIPSVWRWHLTSVQYQLNSIYGVFIGKINVGQIVQDGQQYLSNPNEQLEIEIYPVINRSTYLYADYGYSWCSFFPLHRMGLEPFKILPDDWEISAGIRNLIIKAPPSYVDIPIITGSIGKYFADNWLSYRPFVSFSPNHTKSLASFLFYRCYLGVPENYLGCMLGYGVSPDDKYNDSGQFIHFDSNSYHIRFDIQHHVYKRLLFRFLSEYIYESYLTNLYHFRFVNDLYVAYSF